MAAFAVVVLLGLVVVVPALVAGVVLATTGRHDAEPVRAARRHDTLITLTTVLAALLTAVGVLSLPVTWTASYLPAPPAPGALLAAGPFAVAVAACLVRVAGELTWPRPRGTVRTAPLTRRTVRELAGWRLLLLLATAALLVVVLVVTGLTATDSTTVASPERPLPGGGTVSGAAGPYPGWPYGVPMLLGLAVALVAAAVTLGVVARRAPLEGLGHAEDDVLRRASTARLLAVLQLCVGGAAAVVLATAGGAARNAGTAHYAVDDLWQTSTDPALTTLGTAALVMALLVAVGSAVAAVTAVGAARRREPRTAPTPTTTETR
ncbi:hypothetical protein ATJ88_3029 [Isoptericola jiangsuensis]|uniref:Uncharacterized protein n=1 Tax=Isoptericola jiangsuensis TaxID=548579 RepID=A0A2A9EYT3_9MICO|nr:hypothetical protein [Isoptericola jiangsuensis]PFG44307.1 hypothetical protein ATJ88_3029 [Isoptericola jiangsuensis]